MPRRRMMDRGMYQDGRNPYGAEGGYVVNSRRMRRRGGRDRAMSGDMGMNYGYNRDYRGGDMEYGSRQGDMAYSQQDYERNRRNYESMGQSDMAGNDYGDMRDMHHMGRSGNYRPVEAMGYFTGYYGGGQDMARGGRRDYNYDYGYDMRGRGYGYDYAGDFGEKLTKEELEHWCKEMMSKLEDREKQMLAKESILQRAKAMGIQFDGFNEMEYYVNVVKNYTDHKKSIGENLDMAMKLARDDFFDEDGEYKGSEWLAVYYDTFVQDDD